MSETTMLLRMAASLPSDPRHKQLLNKAADDIEQLQRENDALVARVAVLIELLEKVISDSDIGVVPRSHLNKIQKALSDG